MLYFVALLLPEDLSREITRLKLDIKKRFNSQHALNSPPHITLLMPFRPETKNLPELHTIIKNFAKQYRPFDVQLNHISHFGDRVIFIDVKKESYLFNVQDKLETLARNTPKLFNYSGQKRTFRPHISLAFRDLTADNFHRAIAALKNLKFEQTFSVEGIHLLKKEEGMNWEIDSYFGFNK